MEAADFAAEEPLEGLADPDVTEPVVETPHHHSSIIHRPPVRSRPSGLNNTPSSAYSATAARISYLIAKDKSLSSWKIFYSGEGCVRDFFLAIEENKYASDIPDEYLVRRFHELLTGSALKFFRSIRKEGLSYQQVKSQFFTAFGTEEFDYTTEQNIRCMKQGSSQPFKDFLINVRDLNSKLSSPIPDNALLSIVRHNINDNLKHCIVPIRITDFEHLTEVATRFEAIPKPQPKIVSAVASHALCPKCDQPGHHFRTCPNVSGMVCFKCKTPGVITRWCPKCSSSPSTSKNA